MERVVGATLPGGVSAWTEDDIILYHLGVGAGRSPTCPSELEYTLETQLKVLPSYGVLPGFGLLPRLVDVEGLSFDPIMLLHGEQDLVIHRTLPVRGTVNNSAQIADVYDKG